MKLTFFLLILIFAMCNPAAAAQRAAAPGDFENNSRVESFVDDLVACHQFERAELLRWFKHARLQRGVLRAISRQSVASSWYEYRASHIGAARVRAGLDYWQRNADVLARAAVAYGVPAEIIVATIGIETSYGREVGKVAVFDALATLAFAYPPRAELFRGELEQLLLLAREHHDDPLQYRGSYAGALGVAQFLPSSYRRYAVDFNGDGRRDLWSDADAIGSVAYYYQEHGWRAGETVAVMLQQSSDPPGDAFRVLLAGGMAPHTTVAAVAGTGLTAVQDMPGDAPVSVFALTGEDGVRYWLGFNNFYVITRYNHSINYAMAVYELAQQLRSARLVADVR